MVKKHLYQKREKNSNFCRKNIAFMFYNLNPVRRAYAQLYLPYSTKSKAKYPLFISSIFWLWFLFFMNFDRNARGKTHLPRVNWVRGAWYCYKKTYFCESSTIIIHIYDKQWTAHYWETRVCWTFASSLIRFVPLRLRI